MYPFCQSLRKEGGCSRHFIFRFETILTIEHIAAILGGGIDLETSILGADIFGRHVGERV